MWMNISLIQESSNLYCEPGFVHFEGQLAAMSNVNFELLKVAVTTP